MAPARRRHPVDLRERLRREPYRFSFYQAVRLLNLSAPQRKAQGVPDGLQFRTRASLGFPASEVHRITPSGTDDGEDMEVSFMGLTGPSGILPTAYTEQLMERRANRDDGLHRFLDIFSHRAISLMHQAWLKSRFCFQHEANPSDDFTAHLLDLAGRVPRRSGDTGTLPAEALAFFSGTLTRRPFPASSLEQMAAVLAGAPTRLEQFVGCWLPLAPGDRCQLGTANALLGRDAVVGSRTWNRQTCIRLRVGPIPHARLSAFLPGGRLSGLLAALVQDTLGLTITCELQISLEAESIPTLCPGVEGARLGQETWLATRPFGRVREDVRIRLTPNIEK